MMTASEQLDWGLREAEKSRLFVESAIKSQRWDLAQLNQASAFNDLFEVMLLAWRKNMRQPQDLLEQVISCAESTERLERSVIPPEMKVPGSFPYERCNLVLFLGERKACLFPMCFTDISPVSERSLNTLLVQRLAGEALSASWSDTLAVLAKNKRAKLAVETYQTYDSIINAAESGDMDLARLHAKHAAALFLKRAKDKYYEGGPASEGGGPANEFVVDYALAAIQRRYFSSPAPGAEIHWWHWS